MLKLYGVTDKSVNKEKAQENNKLGFAHTELTAETGLNLFVYLEPFSKSRL